MFAGSFQDVSVIRFHVRYRKLRKRRKQFSLNQISPQPPYIPPNNKGGTVGLVLANSGEILLLGIALDSTGGDENFSLRLYQNDYTPVATSDDTSFTECDFTGYSSKSLTRGSWGTATTDTNGDAAIQYGSTQTFSSTDGTPQTAYGYYVTGATSGTLYWAERFATERILSNGDSLNLTPSVILKSEN